MKPEMNSPVSFSTALAWLRATRRHLIVRGPKGFVIMSLDGKKALTTPEPTNGHAAMQLYRTTARPQSSAPSKGRFRAATRHSGSAGVDFSNVTL